MKFGGPIDMLHGSLWDKVLAFTLLKNRISNDFKSIKLVMG